MTGGVLSVLQGGKFGHGFASAGLTKAFTPAISKIQNTGARVMTAAIVGGTISEATGGKFANGAVTAAMGYAFNQASQADESNRAREETEGRPLNGRQRAALLRNARRMDSWLASLDTPEKFLSHYPDAKRFNVLGSEREAVNFVRDIFQQDLRAMQATELPRYVVDQSVGVVENVLQDATLGTAIKSVDPLLGKGWNLYSYSGLADHVFHLRTQDVLVGCAVDYGCRYFVGD